MQNNAHAHDHGNGNRGDNGDNNIATAYAGGAAGENGAAVRAMVNSREGEYRLIRDKKGKRYKWFSLLTCGSEHY